MNFEDFVTEYGFYAGIGMIALGFVLLVVVFYAKNKKNSVEEIDTSAVNEGVVVDENLAAGSSVSMEAGEMMNSGIAPELAAEEVAAVASDVPVVDPLEVPDVESETPVVEEVVASSEVPVISEEVPVVETPEIPAAEEVPVAVAPEVPDMESETTVAEEVVASSEVPVISEEVPSVEGIPVVETPEVLSVDPAADVEGASASAAEEGIAGQEIPIVDESVAVAEVPAGDVSSSELSTEEVSASDAVSEAPAVAPVDEFHDEVVVDQVPVANAESVVPEASESDVEMAVDVTSASIPPTQQ